MKVLSLKLKEEIFEEVEMLVKKFHISRNAYINEALLFYNKINRRRFLKKQMEKASALVKASSLEVLQEFENIGDGPTA